MIISYVLYNIYSDLQRVHEMALNPSNLKTDIVMSKVTLYHHTCTCLMAVFKSTWFFFVLKKPAKIKNGIIKLLVLTIFHLYILRNDIVFTPLKYTIKYKL